MNKQKQKAVKDKLKGTIQEAQGVLTSDKQLELKGKARQNIGKAHGLVGDLQDQTEDMKDKVVGTVKEKAGEVAHLKPVELAGKAQKAYGEADRRERVLFGLGMVSLITFLIGIIVAFSGDEEE